MLPVVLFVFACAPVEQAPDGWSAPLCDASTALDPAVLDAAVLDAAASDGAGLDGAGLDDRTSRTRLQLDDDVRILALRRYPRDRDCAPAVVLVPPGLEWGQRLMDDGEANILVAAGAAVYSFDPRGRGGSEGEEDVNGFRGQDDLAAVLRWVAAQPDVDSSRVAVSSRSFGGALAAGALGRHPDLLVAGWVDVESPGFLQDDLEYASEDTRTRMLALVDPDDPEGWWAEREPAGLIGGVQAPYQRFQGLPDHALGPRTLHAAAMLDNAVLAASLSYNGQVVDRDDIDAGFVRDNVIDGALDPDDPVVIAAVAAMMQAGAGAWGG